MYGGDSFSHSYPEVGSGAFCHAFACPCEADVLAWGATRDNVYSGYGSPINGGDVPKVGCVGEVFVEDAGGGVFYFADPLGGCSECAFYGEC